MVFQRTSISPIPRKSPFPFEIRKTVYQAHSFARLSSQKAAWVRPTTISHFEGSYDSSRVDAHIQARRCFAFIPDGLPALFRYRWQTALDTSSSSGTDLSTGNGYSAANMLLPGGGRDLRYSSTFSSVIFAMVTRAEGGGGSSVSRYYPLIQIHASFMKGGSDVKRASISDPNFSARRFRSSFRISHTYRPITQKRRWS